MSIKLPLFEDVATLIGLLVAAPGLSLAEVTRSLAFDGFASLGIGAI